MLKIQLDFSIQFHGQREFDHELTWDHKICFGQTLIKTLNYMVKETYAQHSYVSLNLYIIRIFYHQIWRYLPVHPQHGRSSREAWGLPADRHWWWLPYTHGWQRWPSWRPKDPWRRPRHTASHRLRQRQGVAGETFSLVM